MRMRRTRTLAAFFVGLAVTACSTPEWSQTPSTNKARMNVSVQFTDASLNPQTARVLAGGNLVWLNYSTDYVGALLFPTSIKEAFTCDELRPVLMETGDGYQSIPITRDSENFTLPCPLKAGSYDYTVQLFRGMGIMQTPTSVMNGTIVVE